MRVPTAGQVRLRKLHARCPADAAPTVVPALEAARWPTIGRDEWVFVRSVEASGPPALIAERVVASLRGKLAGGTREVVRFASEARMIAALMADIAHGRAGGCWYWRDWQAIISLPPPQALGRLMQACLPQLAAASAHLAADRELGVVWAALDENSAIAVTEALADHGGHRFAPEPGGPGGARNPERIEPGSRSTQRLPPVLRARWSPVLARLARRDARRRLALQLMAMECAPLVLLALGTGMLRAMDGELPAADSEPANERSDDTPSRPAPTSRPAIVAQAMPQARMPTADEVRSQELPEGAIKAPPAGTRTRPGGATPQDIPGSPGPSPAPFGGQDPSNGIAPESITSARDPTGSPLATGPALGVDEPARPRGHDELPAGFVRFETDYGGLFRLANMLARPQACAIMLQHADDMPAGWAWLYRLGSELGFDETDPLAGFIAERLGLDGAAELDELPPLPAREALLGLALRWYPAPDLWGPGLLRLAARVEAGPTHVDVHSRLSDVRLDLRLAGLDLDPGWLPWLGCVLRFHHD